jgi:hypothetical protein
VGARKELSGFPLRGMHTGSLQKLPKDLTCRINKFALSPTGQAAEFRIVTVPSFSCYSLCLKYNKMVGYGKGKIVRVKKYIMLSMF